ncbi:MAG: hypothetical protein AABZ39_13820 [Spirochaetota bacterium]
MILHGARSAVLVLAAALFIFVSPAFAAIPEEDYWLEAVYNGTPVGTTHVHFTWQSPGNGTIAIDIVLRVPVLFFVIPVNRSWYFTVTNYTELVTYYCDSRIEFGSYHYKLFATNYRTNVYIRKETADGDVSVRWVPRSAYDFLTGDQYSEVLVSGITSNRTLRFLDLDSDDLYSVEYTLHSNYQKLINKRPETIYAMTVKAGFLAQELQVMMRTGVPVSLRINIPVAGWMDTRLTNALIEDMPAEKTTPNPRPLSPSKGERGAGKIF